MGIITEYLKYQQEYEEKYGKKTVILYQNGSFFEIFEYDPANDETGELPPWPTEKLGHATYISTLLPYTLTRRNKSKPYSLTNPSMIGFPMIAYEQHRDKILSREYSIVLVEQERPGKDAPRRVTKVLSPATEIDDLAPIPVTNQIVSIYIEVQKDAVKFEEYLITAGVSTIDVTTGNNVVAEIYSKEKDEIHAMQEIYRFLLSTTPRELIINVTRIKKDQQDKYKSYLIQNLELNKYNTYTIIMDGVDKEYFKPHYQQQFLSKIFVPSVTLKGPINLNIKPVLKIDSNIIIEELGLERMHYGTVSYILLLQYCYEHDERLIEKIRRPDTHWMDEDIHLVTTHNALRQLDVLSRVGTKEKGINSLLSVVNKTSTSLGRRYLQNILCNPITNPVVLNNYYDMVDDLIGNNELISEIEKILKGIPDMERYQRKLQLKLIKPSEFCTLFRAYIDIVTLYTVVAKSQTRLTGLLFNQVQDFNTCLTTVLTKYNLDNLASARIDNEKLTGTDDCIFYPGKDEYADKCFGLIKESNDKIHDIVTHLNSHLADKTRGKLIEYKFDSDKSGVLGFFTTPHKGKVLTNCDIDTNLCGKIYYVSVNSKVLITSDVIGSLCQNITQIKTEYEEYIYRCYNTTISEISTKYNFFPDINLFVSKLDYVKANARSAVKNNYHRPVISDDNNHVSFLEIKGLRHPVAEKIIDSPYVTNDISLGLKPYGMLLYGANSVGKSTLAKAVGLNLIMAQAGMFTPCHIRYKPYSKIITRLSGEDNLIQGKSSFIIEMSELRTILRNADEKTLVLGDELCRGTETASGSGITIQAIIELIKRKTSFIFATHMHHLVTNRHIMGLPEKTLRICHLVLKYDHANKTLIYDRKIKEGPGEAVYGLEVAMSLSMDLEFIRGAAKIRKEILGQPDKILTTKRSKHNKKVYVHACTLCGKPTDLETHHLEEQNKANENGFIDHYHKDISSNLEILCSDCHHKKIHGEGVQIIKEHTPSGNITKIK